MPHDGVGQEARRRNASGGFEFGYSPKCPSWLPEKLFSFGLARLLIIIRLRSYTCRGQMAQEDRRGPSWKRENEVSEEWIQFVDDNVLAGKAELELSVAKQLTNLRYSELPQGTQIIGVIPHGASY
jgi:hypothetical protein